jgi:hypothetical protein
VTRDRDQRCSSAASSSAAPPTLEAKRGEEIARKVLIAKSLDHVELSAARALLR